MDESNTKLAHNRNIGTCDLPDADIEKSGCGCWSSKRYFLIGILFLGTIGIRSLSTNISISIIEMTKNRTELFENQTVQYEPEFQWDSKQRGVILSAYGYGFLASIIGAPIARKFGAVTTYGYALVVAGVVTILNPHIARFNYYLLLAARFLEGVLVTTSYVANADILSRWSSKGERSKMVSIVTSGANVGTVITYPVCGLLAQFWGWPSTFYFTGAIVVVISLVTLFSFGNIPSQDKCISKNELELLTRELEDSSNEKIPHLWKKMFAAKPLWALPVTEIGTGCSFALIVFCLPLYVRDMTGMEIHHIGFLSSIPNIATMFTIPVAGFMADYFQNSKILTATQVHKIYMTAGFVLGAMCLFAVSSISHFNVNLVLLVIFMILLSLGQLTMITLPIYIAPRHSSLIAAINSYGFSIGVFITPTLMGFIVTSHDPAQWSICIATVGVITLLAGVIFLTFGSSEVLEMFRVKPSPENEENKEALLECEITSTKETNFSKFQN